MGVEFHLFTSPSGAPPLLSPKSNARDINCLWKAALSVCQKNSNLEALSPISEARKDGLKGITLGCREGSRALSGGFRSPEQALQERVKAGKNICNSQLQNGASSHRW